jgi:hypothetical protein
MFNEGKATHCAWCKSALHFHKCNCFEWQTSARLEIIELLLKRIAEKQEATNAKNS